MLEDTALVGSGPRTPGHQQDLLSFASPSDVLVLAARALIGLGADRATSQFENGRGELILIGCDGFGSEFFDHFAVVEGPSTPCGVAAAAGDPVMIEDVASDAALGGTEHGDVIMKGGSRACLSYPLVDGDGTVLGVISAHWSRPGWREGRAAVPLVTEVTRRLKQARRHLTALPQGAQAREVDGLREALTTRTVIAQAQGVLMARQKVGSAEAFDILRRASQRTNTKLRDVAARIVAGVEPPDRSRPPAGRA